MENIEQVSCKYIWVQIPDGLFKTLRTFYQESFKYDFEKKYSALPTEKTVCVWKPKYLKLSYLTERGWDNDIPRNAIYLLYKTYIMKDWRDEKKSIPQKIWAWLIKTFSNPWFILSVLAAFIGMISYFQINSYRADKNGLNGFWLVTGIVFTLGAIYLMYKAYKSSDGKGG